MKLRSVTYALLIAGVATFSTSSLAAQSYVSVMKPHKRFTTYCGEKI